MKKLFQILAIAATLVACSKDETVPVQGTYTLTGYTNVETKTDFGTPSGNTIPFEWSAGDKIWSNGTQSGAAEIDESTGKAVFSFANTPGTAVYYNMTGSSNQANVHAAQSIENNLGANGDFGYAQVSNGSFTLYHATAYLWFNVTTSIANATLEWIKVDAADVDIAGKATWNGSEFDSVTEGSKSVTLTVDQTLAATNSNVWAMVVLPADFTGKEVKVTYKLTVGGADKYYKQTLTEKSLTAGKTQKITTVIAESDLTDYMELRVLTFEDKAGDSYWANLIPAEDEQCYGGSELLYPSLFGSDYIYSWSDAYTKLEHKFPYNWNLYDFSGGGYAVSTHTGTMDELEIAYNAYSMYDYQLSIPLDEGHDNSENFCIGYHDSFLNLDDEIKPAICFSDGVPRVIDHMYVTNTSITMYSILNGSDFSSAFSDGDFLDIVATGYVGNVKGNSVRFRLADGDATIVDDWEKWDLSSLGAVTKVVFHMEENQTYDTGWNGLAYCSPLYFAFDDVAVRF